LEGELTSSWLYRVAAANLVELEELLSGLLELYPEMPNCSNICLDYDIAPGWSRALFEEVIAREASILQDF
jgi:hypothetical protein